MTALAKDRNTVRKEGEYAAYPVKADAKIYGGGMVCVGADGYAIPASDTAGLKFVGISRSAVDATGAASGGLIVEVWREGNFELTAGQNMVAEIGTLVCVVDDETVDLADVTTHDVAVGIIAEVNSATSVYIDIERRA